MRQGAQHMCVRRNNRGPPSGAPRVPTHRRPRHRLGRTEQAEPCSWRRSAAARSPLAQADTPYEGASGCVTPTLGCGSAPSVPAMDQKPPSGAAGRRGPASRPEWLSRSPARPPGPARPHASDPTAAFEFSRYRGHISRCAGNLTFDCHKDLRYIPGMAQRFRSDKLTAPASAMPVATCVWRSVPGCHIHARRACTPHPARRCRRPRILTRSASSARIGPDSARLARTCPDGA